MTIPVNNTVAIGGVGGSGTRLIAQIVDRLGFFIGDTLNRALDNLYFTLLFKRHLWFREFPTDADVSEAIRLFQKAMTLGLSGLASDREIYYVQQIAAQLELADLPTGVSSLVAKKLLESIAPDLDGRVGWGWKEPNTHLFLAQMAAGISDLKYIHVLRNGLDMAFSQNQQQPKNWMRYICGKAFDIHASLPQQSLNFWITANRRAIEISKEWLGDRFLLLNYDDLCESPHEGVQLLADFLDVGLSQEELEELAALVAPKSTGRWKQHGSEVFSDEQLNAVRILGFDIAH